MLSKTEAVAIHGLNWTSIHFEYVHELPSVTVRQKVSEHRLMILELKPEFDEKIVPFVSHWKV